MEIRPVKTKAAYRAALKEIESLMKARANTAEGERLDVLVTLVEAYERISRWTCPTRLRPSGS
jgi:HTH-type transcriptional regulator/antitoxin HigA